MASPSYCTICEANPVKARDRCSTCLEYLRRTGRERPRHLAERQFRLNNRPALDARRRLLSLRKHLTPDPE